MKNINDVLGTLREYLIEIGVDLSIVDSALTISAIKSILVMKLPAVSLLKENRVNSKSKQTHIHVTGSSMTHFYTQEQLNTADASSDDEQIRLNLFSKNIDNLLDQDQVLGTNQEIVKSSTVKKIAIRKDNSMQVQISKLKFDDKAFLMLRKCLFEHDYLVFISYHNTNEQTVIGLKESKHVLDDGDNTKLFTNNLGNILKQDILSESSSEYPVNNRGSLNRTSPLKSVTPETIANFNPTDEDDNDDELNRNLVDLGQGIKIRKKRTERHHDIVKKLARVLDLAGYDLSEYPIDCLASKDNNPLLIFEVKTLDGSASDERKQVLNCFGQLFYYEAFDVTAYPHTNKQKIAVFESKISEEHINFLQSNGIFVMWMEDSEFIFTYELSSFFSEISFL